MDKLVTFLRESGVGDMRRGKQAEAPRLLFKALLTSSLRHYEVCKVCALFPCFWGWPEVHKILRGDGTGVKYCYFWWQ